MKKRRLTREDMDRHSFKAHLREQLKNPRFAKAFHKQAQALNLGYQIFIAREKAGLTQAELAKRIGTRQANISRLEQGDYNFTVEMLEKIAKALQAKLKIEIIPAPSIRAAA